MPTNTPLTDDELRDAIVKAIISDPHISIGGHYSDGTPIDDESAVDDILEIIKQRDALHAKQLNLAIIDQKIDTLKICDGHQQTGTSIDHQYFAHNIGKLYDERQKLTQDMESRDDA